MAFANCHGVKCSHSGQFQVTNGTFLNMELERDEYKLVLQYITSKTFKFKARQLELYIQ